MKVFYALVLALLMVPNVGGVPGAIGQDKYVDVTSTATVYVKPDFAIVRATITGSGDTASDSAQDFLQKKREMMDVFDPMEYQGVEIIVSKPALNSAAAQGGPVYAVPMAADGAVEVEQPGFSSTSKIKFKIELDSEASDDVLIETIDKIATGMKKAELNYATENLMGLNTSLIEFEVKDQTAAIDAALAKAVAEARRKAAVIAKLGDKNLGDVISIEEMDSTSTASTSQSYMQMLYSIYGMETGQTDSKLNSAGELPVQVTIRARFELR